jgi:hypothetical protein
LQATAVVGDMKRTCFLHIGTEKTGTTSIQNFLSKNRSRLKKQGIIYPRSPGNQNHTDLTVYALADERQSGGIRRHSGVASSEQLPGFRDRLQAKLDSELQNSRASTIIFSNEHLSSRLANEIEIARVKELCERCAAQTKVIVYLRNQVDYIVSSFGTTVKSGSTRKFPFPLNKRRIRTMDYMALLEPWRKIFGRGNMIVRRFDPSDFVEGDLLLDFAEQIPFDSSGFIRSEPRNEALSARELAFLREFNARVPRWVDGEQNPARGNVVAALVRSSDSSSRLTVSPEIAEAIMAQFEESNRRVSKEYFGDKWQPLFSEPNLVSDADVDSLLELRLGDAMDIACRLWSEQELRLQGLEQKRKKHRARRSGTGVTASADQDDFI